MAPLLSLWPRGHALRRLWNLLDPTDPSLSATVISRVQTGP